MKQYLNTGKSQDRIFYDENFNTVACKNQNRTLQDEERLDDFFKQQSINHNTKFKRRL